MTSKTRQCIGTGETSCKRFLASMNRYLHPICIRCGNSCDINNTCECVACELRDGGISSVSLGGVGG